MRYEQVDATGIARRMSQLEIPPCQAPMYGEIEDILNPSKADSSWRDGEVKFSPNDVIYKDLPGPTGACVPSARPTEANESCDDIPRNALGLPYQRINGGSYAPFFSRSAVTRLHDEWEARPDDVFLVFPSQPVTDDFQAFSVALVEQCDVSSFNPEFPRWIDAAVSCRGWGYVDAIDTLNSRRCLTTQVPPWRFPSKSFKWDPCSLSKSQLSEQAKQNETNMPLFAVFIADPRIMIMKELSTAMKYAEYATRKGCIKARDSQVQLNRLLEAMVNNDMCDSSGMGILGNSLRSAYGWAKAEELHPSRIRLFFTEDFILEPEVAMRGLADFLQVPGKGFSAATDNIFKQASRLAQHSSFNKPSAHGPLDVTQSMTSASIEDLVMEFETQLAKAPDEVRFGWAKLIEDNWMRSPNPCMVTFGQTVLKHDMWSPLKWLASHNARICRPCLFFPRGTCTNDECPYCHGSNHPKPKRTAKSKRASRRRFDRTPSPDTPHMHPQLMRMPSPQLLDFAPVKPNATYATSAQNSDSTSARSAGSGSQHSDAGGLSNGASAQLRFDRTPSPELVWRSLKDRTVAVR